MPALVVPGALGGDGGAVLVPLIPEVEPLPLVVDPVLRREFGDGDRLVRRVVPPGLSHHANLEVEY